jgi:hypothetical protein
MQIYSRSFKGLCTLPMRPKARSHLADLGGTLGCSPVLDLGEHTGCRVCVVVGISVEREGPPLEQTLFRGADRDGACANHSEVPSVDPLVLEWRIKVRHHELRRHGLRPWVDFPITLAPNFALGK